MERLAAWEESALLRGGWAQKYFAARRSGAGSLRNRGPRRSPHDVCAHQTISRSSLRFRRWAPRTSARPSRKRAGRGKNARAAKKIGGNQLPRAQVFSPCFMPRASAPRPPPLPPARLRVSQRAPGLAAGTCSRSAVRRRIRGRG